MNNNKSNLFLSQIQSLRFLAFTFIFMGHVNMWTGCKDFVLGATAGSVAFFIMLSGFLSGFKNSNKEIKLSLKSVFLDISSFLKKFYPLYFVTIMLGAVYSAIPEFFVKCKGLIAIDQMKTIGIDFLLLQSWLPDLYIFNGVGWFVSTMFFLVALKTPICYLANQIKSKGKRYIVFFVVLLIGLQIFYCYQIRDTNLDFSMTTFPISRLCEYIIGILVGTLTKDLIEEKEFSTLYFSIAEFIAVLIWVAAIFIPLAPWLDRIVRWLVPNILIIFIFSIGKGVLSKILKNKILVSLGNVSFECFIIHQCVLRHYWISTDIFETKKSGSIFSFIYCYILVIIIAKILYNKRYEKEQFTVKDND